MVINVWNVEKNRDLYKCFVFLLELVSKNNHSVYKFSVCIKFCSHDLCYKVYWYENLTHDNISLAHKTHSDTYHWLSHLPGLCFYLSRLCNFKFVFFQNFMFFHSLLGVIQSLHEKKQNMMSWNVERFFGGDGVYMCRI